MRVLLVEDEAVAARGITLMLKAAGAVVDQTDGGEDALELLRHYEYDIVLLDLALPDIEGFEVVRRMRISRNDTPVLVLSGLTMPQARVKALSLGADDFITKPFDKAELLARMQAIVRRSKGFSQPTVRLGRLELNLDSREVTVDGREVHLTGKEYSILELLVLRKGMVLTKEAFLNHLYGGMDEPEVKPRPLWKPYSGNPDLRCRERAHFLIVGRHHHGSQSGRRLRSSTFLCANCEKSSPGPAPTASSARSGAAAT